jgi:iron complex transport system substrate-binding protein
MILNIAQGGTSMRLKHLSILLGIVLTFAFVLTGCAQSEKTAQSEDKKVEEAKTRTVKTVKGDVEIPTNPKRVITDFYLADLLALGVKPVGSIQMSLNNPYIKDKVEGIEDIGTPVSIEKVLSLKPDLIIMQSDENYEKLSKIAPTVVIPYASEGDFYAELRKIADLVGKKDEAEKWIQSFEKKAEEARYQLKDIVREGETFGLYELQEDKLWVFGDNWGRGGQVIYKALKLSPPEKMQELMKQGTQYKELSLEALPEFAADNMFVTTWSAQGSNDKKLEELKNSPIWKNLDAVQNNKVYEMKFDDMYYADPYSLEGQLDLMVEKIVESHKK